MPSAYFQPVAADVIHGPDGTLPSDAFGQFVQVYQEGGVFPSYEGARIALIGVGEERGAVGNTGCAGGPDHIRRELYKLKRHAQTLPVIDLGNLRIGHTVSDTYAAIATVVHDLLSHKVIPVILGGSQDLTYGHYCGYKLSEQIINIVSVDPRFDLGLPEEPNNNQTYLGKIILEQPNYLFNFSNLAYQTYFTGVDNVALMKKMHFDTYRLGQVQGDISEAEPVVRNADLVTVDISVVRQSDAPGCGMASPNGLYGEELCQIMLYAGMSDKLSGLGFYEYNPLFDRHTQTAQLIAQAIWYFLEGVFQRKLDVPISNPNSYLTYRVTLEELDQEITFIKSMKSDRWWIKLPTDGARNRYLSQHLLPCTYKDYQQACNNEVPERWWNAVHKMI